MNTREEKTQNLRLTDTDDSLVVVSLLNPLHERGIISELTSRAVEIPNIFDGITSESHPGIRPSFPHTRATLVIPSSVHHPLSDLIAGGGDRELRRVEVVGGAIIQSI